jgi:hypothetical protein
MYCPKCSTQNLDDIKFCRQCGYNLEMVKQVLKTDQLPQVSTAKPAQHGDKHAPSMEHAIQKVFAGLGLICVAFACLFFAPAGKIWWFWMLIPAFGSLGKGAAEYFSVKNRTQNALQTNQLPQYQQPPYQQPAIPPPPASVDYRPRNTGEMVQPPSVTESTTKLFDPPNK